MVHCEAESRQELQRHTGTEAETMEGCCILAYAQLAFLYSQDLPPSDGATHSEHPMSTVGHPMSVINQENDPKALS